MRPSSSSSSPDRTGRSRSSCAADQVAERREITGVAIAGRGVARVGVALCGGRSRRMGRDKAQLDVGGRSMLEASLAALDGLCERVLLASGAEVRHPETGRECVLDRFADAGPLAGLEAAMVRIAEESGEAGAWVVTLGCDMPRSDPRVLRALLAREIERNADACLLATEGGVEPLCAVYHTRCRDAVRRGLEAGERRMTSFHEGYGELRVETLPQAELAAELLALESHRNVNTPHELEAERRSSR